MEGQLHKRILSSRQKKRNSGMEFRLFWYAGVSIHGYLDHPDL